jgi:2',3'-cyclic-nucleotide 2'-phosphodiesterase / 3'-nucleotidase
METTDIHVNIYPYDYYADKAVDTVGLARTATLIAGIRAEATNSILIDNGDFLQGNPMGDYMAYEKGMDGNTVHPAIEAMNVLGVEASTLGNHEFNYGLSFLEKSLTGARFPIVSANVIKKQGASPRQDQLLLKPYVILDREITDGAGEKHKIRIGLIGFVPPQVMQWDRHNLEGNVTTRDIVSTAAAWVPEIKERGADLIIALSHSGIGAAKHIECAENASIPLARVEGIDALLTGHGHLVFPSPTFKDHADVDVSKGTIGGKPAVMAGFWGSHMGLIDLMLERDGAMWRVVSFTTEARPIYQRKSDLGITASVASADAILAAVKPEHDATLAYIRRPVGKITAPLQSYFALVADDPSVQIVANAKLWYMADMLQGTPWQHLPLLSAVAPFKAGGRSGPDYYTDVPAGDVAIKNVADLYLYPNKIRAVKITGAQVKDWLERSAGIYNHITAGEPDQMLLNPNFPSYNFDVLDGVTYQIDVSQPSKFDMDGNLIDPEANRIVHLAYRGLPVDPAAEFVVATNSYRAGGGGQFPGAKGDTMIFEGPDTVRDILVRYLVENGTINPTADANWHLAPLPGTSVLFDTGRRAAAYVDDVKGIAVTHHSDGPNGFARFRITL